MLKWFHNGIEQGMLGIVCEAWGILHALLGFSEDDIGHIFTDWSKKKVNYIIIFLYSIGGEICTRHYKSDDLSSGHVLDDIEDKVVQDADNTEGTGVWSSSRSRQSSYFCPKLLLQHIYYV